MKRFIVLVSGLAIASATAFALPAACVTTTYTAYLALGAIGCQDGDATFSNFGSLSFVNSSGVPTIPTDDILVTPGGTALNPTLTFTYVNASKTPTPVTVNQPGQIFSFGFSYAMILTGATLTSIEMDTTLSNSNGGNVAATKNVSSGGPTFTSSANDNGVSNAANTLIHGPATLTSGAATTWAVQDTVSLQAQSTPGGTATQNSFVNTFNLTAATTGTPEPMTFLMIGTGLMCLGFVSRRKRHIRN